MTKNKITHHLSMMLATTIIGMVILEYFGWMIIEKMMGESRFPGFLSGEVILSVIVNSSGAFLTGFFVVLIAFVFPGFRRNWKMLIHIPLWIGIVTFLSILTTLVITGLYSV